MKKVVSLFLSFIIVFNMCLVTNVSAIAQTASNVDSQISLEGMPIVDHGSYQGNQGDSTVYNLNGQGLSMYDQGKRFNNNGNVGIDGTTYSNGFEVWIARWNFRNEISWAYATFDIGGKYKTLTGKTNLIGSYNTTNFDTTIYFYDGETLLASYNLTNADYIEEINVDVSGVEQLKLLIKDNVAVKGGTSFALYDMFLHDGDVVSSDTVIHPTGYDFYADSYNFSNYGESISKEYFTTIYEDGPGTLLYNSKKNISKNGLCFGMAYTTAAIYNGLPDCSNISTLDGSLFEYKYCDNIREIVNYNLGFSFNDVCSAFAVGENTISVEDYIKYAFIYQWSSDVATSTEQTWGDVQGLYNAVKSFTDNDLIGVTIGMTHFEVDASGNPVRDSEGNYITSGHRVLAVGYDGKDILIDDPNNTDSLERLTINDDWSWSYSGAWEEDGVNNDNSITRYQVDCYRPYQIILTGNATTTNTTGNENQSKIETYVEDMDEIDADSTLVYINCDDVSSLPNNAIKIGYDDCLSTDEVTSLGSLYWIDGSNQFVVSKITGTDNEISLAGDDKILSVILDGATDFSGIIEEETTDVEFRGNAGENCTITLTTISNDNEIALEVYGEIAEDVVHIQNNDGEVEVIGLSSGTVKLIENDSEIVSKEFTDCNNDFDILYDDSGENFSIQVDMPYKDVSKNAWYYDYVYDVYEKGLMTGMNETTFAPDVVLSRAHFATILWRMAGSPNAGYKAKFPDVTKGQFYTTAVMWATEKGIITGYADSGLFKPADKITREEIATMLYRYAKYSGENVSNIASLESFPDKSKVSGFAKVPMEWCVAEGIISGDGITGELIPQGDTARAVCATIISRYTSGERNIDMSPQEICQAVADHYNEVNNTNIYVAFESECIKNEDGYFLILRHQGGTSANILVSGITVNTKTGEVKDDFGNKWYLY